MIDLHIHTTVSDGTDTAKEVLEKAEILKLDAISITDHDCIGAYEILKDPNIRNIFSGKIISGSEIKTTYKNQAIEVLAYNFDVEKAKSLEIFNSGRGKNNQYKYLESFKEAGKKLGLKFNDDIKIDTYAGLAFYDELIKYKENFEILPELNEKRESFYRLTASNKNSPFFIDESKDTFDINKIIQDIHSIGGKVFLAHLFVYKLDDYKEFLESLVQNTEIDGIECYYSTFSKEQIEYLLDFCKKNKMLVSGGTDYHGGNKKTISLGVGEGNLNIPNDIIDWTK